MILPLSTQLVQEYNTCPVNLVTGASPKMIDLNELYNV